MLSRTWIDSFVAVILAIAVAGCDSPVTDNPVDTPPPAIAPANGNADVNVDGKRLDVDVDTKPGGGVDVDVDLKRRTDNP